MSYRTDTKADIQPAVDRQESIVLMEPLLIGQNSRHRGELTDLAIELAIRSAGHDAVDHEFRSLWGDALAAFLS
jgi:hypothetical protein